MIISLAKQKSCNSKCFCSPPLEGDLLVLSGSCFYNNHDSKEGLCDPELAIPIVDHSCFRFNLSQDQKMVIPSNKIAIIKIENNKSVWYREIGEYCENPYTINYKLVVDITSANINSNNVAFTTKIKLIPYKTPITVTWNNFGTSFFASGGTTWNSIGMTWEELGDLRLNTLNCYPELTLPEAQQSQQLCFDINSTSANSDYSFEVTNGKYSYIIVLNYSYNSLTSLFDVTLKSIKLRGQFYTEDFNFALPISTFSVVDNNLVAHEELLVLTQKAQKYTSLNSLLFLASITKLGEIELLNQDEEVRELEGVQFS